MKSDYPGIEEGYPRSKVEKWGGHRWWDDPDYQEEAASKKHSKRRKKEVDPNQEGLF